MLSPMTSSLPAPAPVQRPHAAAPARDRQADERSANEAPGTGFGQALDQAQSPDSAQRQAARLRQARLAAAEQGKVRGPGGHPASLQPPQPPQAEGKDHSTLPLEGPGDSAEPPAAEGDPAALLAQLQARALAQASPASAERGTRGDATARGRTAAGSDATLAVDGSGTARSATGPQHALAHDHRPAPGKDDRDQRLARAADELGRAATAAAGSTQALQAQSEDRAGAVAQLLAASAPGMRPAAETGAPTDTALLPPSAAGAGAAAPTGAAAPAAEARLPAALGSPDFGTHLAAQLSTFVRDGIEHARLHLNPAEMGPVSVQIQLDGQMAVVHLGAEHAQTRQALEQALPQLAGQLREAGLTLTGGGVFEHTPQGREGPGTGQGEGQPAPGTPGNAGTWGRGDDRRLDDAGTPLARLPQRRGVVDLVA